MASGSSTTRARGGEEENTKQDGNSRNSWATSRNHVPSSQFHIETAQKHPSSPNRNPSAQLLVTFLRTRRQRTRLARCCSRLPKKICSWPFIFPHHAQPAAIHRGNLKSLEHNSSAYAGNPNRNTDSSTYLLPAYATRDTTTPRSRKPAMTHSMDAAPAQHKTFSWPLLSSGHAQTTAIPYQNIYETSNLPSTANPLTQTQIETSIRANPTQIPRK
jgi:hypothetical protein